MITIIIKFDALSHATRRASKHISSFVYINTTQSWTERQKKSPQQVFYHQSAPLLSTNEKATENINNHLIYKYVYVGCSHT